MTCRDSIAVSIPACHAGDRGSSPRRGDVLFCDVGDSPFNAQLYTSHNGDVAHMVERPLRMREVVGSMPTVSRLSFPFTCHRCQQLHEHLQRSLWCSWLSRQSNTLKVSSSNLDRLIFFLSCSLLLSPSTVRLWPSG